MGKLRKGIVAMKRRYGSMQEENAAIMMDRTADRGDVKRARERFYYQNRAAAKKKVLRAATIACISVQ